MKKIKKIFKFIPSFALIIISGLLSVFSVNKNVTLTNADTQLYPLYNEDFSSSIITSYTFNPGLTDITNTTNFTINGTFGYYYGYVETGKTYNFNFDLKFQNCNSTYYKNFTFDRLFFNDYEVSSSINQFRVDFLSFEGTSRNNNKIVVRFHFQLYLNGVSCGTFDLISNATLLQPSQSTGYAGFKGYPNKTIMDITYNTTDFDTGYAVGYEDGYNAGYNDGYSSGNTNGYNNGYTAGYNAGIGDTQSAYDSGYAAGVAEAGNQSAVANSIFDGIIRVGILPVQFFLSVFNFEVFGINVSVIITSLLAVAITVILIRFITGKKF